MQLFKLSTKISFEYNEKIDEDQVLDSPSRKCEHIHTSLVENSYNESIEEFSLM